MPTTIKPKRTYTPGKEPTIGDITDGELALNVVDGKLWSKDADDNLVLLGGLQDGSSLPTADPVVAGALWNDNGTVRISNG